MLLRISVLQILCLIHFTIAVHIKQRKLSFPTLTVRLNGGTWSHLLSVYLSVCLALLKKVVSPSDCKITGWGKL